MLVINKMPVSMVSFFKIKSSDTPIATGVFNQQDHDLIARSLSFEAELRIVGKKPLGSCSTCLFVVREIVDAENEEESNIRNMGLELSEDIVITQKFMVEITKAIQSKYFKITDRDSFIGVFYADYDSGFISIRPLYQRTTDECGRTTEAGSHTYRLGVPD